MSSEVLVPRPRFHCRVLAPEAEAPSQREAPPPSAGSAALGSRCAAERTPAEWFSNYHSILQRAGADRVVARSVQRESRTLNQDSEADTLQTQADGTRQLGDRLQDIHLLKSELQQKIEQLRADTHALMALRTRLEKALDATHIPYAITTDNLNCRTRRLPPDLVQDSVEAELLKVGVLGGGGGLCWCERLGFKAHVTFQQKDLWTFLVASSGLGRASAALEALQAEEKTVPSPGKPLTSVFMSSFVNLTHVLLQEVELIRSVQALLQKTTAQVLRQIK